MATSKNAPISKTATLKPHRRPKKPIVLPRLPSALIMIALGDKDLRAVGL